MRRNVVHERKPDEMQTLTQDKNLKKQNWMGKKSDKEKNLLIIKR